MKLTKNTVAALGLDGNDPWLSEITDGIAVDAARLHLVAALYRAAVNFADGTPTDALLAAADDALARGQKIVARRHAHLHDPASARLVAADSDNVTIYHYGYLYEADILCYWVRERAQARQLILGTSDTVPGCAIGF